MTDYTFNIQRENGRYYASIYAPSDRWRTRLSLLTTDKAVARQRLTKWERMAARGEWDPREGRPSSGDVIPLKEAKRRFLQAYREEVRDITAKGMEGALRLLVENIGEERPISQVRPTHLAEHIQSLSGRGDDAEPGSAALSTKAQAHSYLGRFFRWLCETGVIDKDPMAEVSRPRVDSSRQSYEVLSPADADALVRVSNIRWWTQLVEVALTSGLRLSELRHMRWGRVDTNVLAGIDGQPDASDFCAIDVEPFETPAGEQWQPKNRYSSRTVMAYPRGSSALRVRWIEQARPEEGWVWAEGSQRPGRGRMQALMRRYGREAGLRPSRQVTIHDLRHTWFSWLLNDLGLADKVPSIAKMGGHGRVSQTWSYVTASDDAAQDALHESVGLEAPQGREDAVREWLCDVSATL